MDRLPIFIRHEIPQNVDVGLDGRESGGFDALTEQLGMGAVRVRGRCWAGALE